MPVSISPGQIAFTRILAPQSWVAATSTRLITPDLEAEYAGPPAPARSPATLAVQMIDPPPRSFITGAAYLIARNGPMRLTRRISFQSAGLCSKIEARPPE